MKNTEFWYFGKVILLLIFFITSNDSKAQSQPNEFWQHVRLGGGIGLSFGDGFFSGTLAPSAIYQFNEQFAAGVALNGTYASLKNQYDATILGGSVLALYNVIPQIQISTEFEQLHVNRNYEYLNLPDFTEKYWYPALFIGVGFHSNNFTLGIRYDVLFDDDKSIYANAFAPFVRVYF